MITIRQQTDAFVRWLWYVFWEGSRYSSYIWYTPDFRLAPNYDSYIVEVGPASTLYTCMQCSFYSGGIRNAFRFCFYTISHFIWTMCYCFVIILYKTFSASVNIFISSHFYLSFNIYEICFDWSEANLITPHVRYLVYTSYKSSLYAICNANTFYAVMCAIIIGC